MSNVSVALTIPPPCSRALFSFLLSSRFYQRGILIDQHQRQRLVPLCMWVLSCARAFLCVRVLRFVSRYAHFHIRMHKPISLSLFASCIPLGETIYQRANLCHVDPKVTSLFIQLMYYLISFPSIFYLCVLKGKAGFFCKFLACDDSGIFGKVYQNVTWKIFYSYNTLLIYYI